MDVVVPFQFKLTLFFLFAACLLVPSIQVKDLQYCDKEGNYVVKVDGIKISPDPVVKSKPATFSISASTDKAISGGKLALEVSYFEIPVHTETHSLCDETSCPISAGKFVLSHTQTLPGIAPPGLYKLKMKMEDENKNQLTCISFKFNIGRGSSVSSI
uniref:MD-2-related lipid-recognition domain-containing protein n=1 Tax=Davidia involucrata TaxID=16924 RepID=A0A5B6ZXG9_DAVIN